MSHGEGIAIPWVFAGDDGEQEVSSWKVAIGPVRRRISRTRRLIALVVPEGAPVTSVISNPAVAWRPPRAPPNGTVPGRADPRGLTGEPLEVVCVGGGSGLRAALSMDLPGRPVQ